MAHASFRSFVEMFHHRVKSTPDSVAVDYKKDGEWVSLLWKDVADRARKVACGLRSLGLQTEERCAILAPTQMEWLLADFGILCGGGATTTIYPTSTPEDIDHILRDSDSRFVFVFSKAKAELIVKMRQQFPNLRGLISFDGSSTPDGFLISLEDLEKRGAAWDAANAGAYDKIGNEITGDQIATLIYTSGTTGKPKGVILTHDAWVFEGEALDALGILSPADKQFLFLPLAHSFGKVLESVMVRIGFRTAIDGDVNSVVKHLGETSPTFMGAVPRIFEKAYNRVITQAREAGSAKGALMNWAFSVGREVSKLRQQGKEPGGFLAMKYAIADKLVFTKIRAIFGGKVRFFISGAAPLSREIAEFFHSVGMLVLEGYGLTESSAGSFVNRPDAYQFGTVGLPMPGVQVRIAPDGEIQLGGRGIMRGYYNMPEATAEALTADGFLNTGDIGELDSKGMLRITDRKKDLIKTSGGKYVAPQSIEGQLKLRSTLISQVVVHGDTRNFCSVLLTVNEDDVKKFLTAAGVSFTDYEDMTKKKELYTEIHRVIEELNKELASYSTLKKFAILPRELSVDDGDLTPSLKVKRRAVEKKYAHILDGFYKDSLA